MKLKYGGLLIATALASTTAMAGGFDGFFVQGGVGFSDTRLKVSERDFIGPMYNFDAKTSKTSFFRSNCRWLFPIL